MDSEELEAEGEALRRTLGRIDFLLKQGFISQEDADCRKQGVMDNFCLAPILDRRRQLQTEDSNATGIGPSRGSANSNCGGRTVSFLATAAIGTTSDAEISGGTTSSDASSSYHSSSTEMSGHVSPLSSAEGGGNSEASGSKRPALPEKIGPSGRLQGQESQSKLEGVADLPVGGSECQTEGCHLLPAPTCGEGADNARLCSQHSAAGAVSVLPVLPTLTAEASDQSKIDDIQVADEPFNPGERPANTSLLTPSPDPRPAIPELSLEARVSGDCRTINSKFPDSSPGMSAVTPPSPAVNVPPSEGTSLSSLGGGAAPIGTTTPAAEDAVEMLSVGAEPTPPTVSIPVDFKRGSCEWQECTKEPHYALKGQRARTCFAHKQDGWVHVSRRRCDEESCPRGAYFSLQGSTAIFCSTHRSPAMLDVVNLRRYRCHAQDCVRQAYYNYVGMGRNKAMFCSTHKLADMLNVRHRLCDSPGCRTTPTYSCAGDRPRFCAAHKAEGMVDTKSKTCAFTAADGSNCLKCRLYGAPDGKATYCFTHKAEGMINIRQARKRKSL